MFLEIINEIWETGTFRPEWKEAIMIPIHKKGKDADNPASYRPISLLPFGAKLMESLVIWFHTYWQEASFHVIKQDFALDTAPCST